jgi:glycosyltransferase involved in cell wall biosynthesis
VDGERILISLEDEDARAVLPFLKLLAAVSPARRIEIINADLQQNDTSRWSLVTDVASIVTTSIRGGLAAARTRRAATALLNTPRIRPLSSAGKRVFYINANLWFGLKAGGSIGHVAGVANALAQRGYELTYAGVGENSMLSAKIECLRLNPPQSFGFPLEYTQYVFDNSTTAQLASALNKPHAFIYQRLSLGNFSGVKLSREFSLPYVLEYNGSEAWAAKNWGRPLKDHELAVAVEEACLQHAHTVVTISEVLKDELVARGVEPERIACYPNCVDPTIFDPGRFDENERVQLRARYGVGRDALIVGFIGTFGMWHGTEILAQAITELTKQPEWLRQQKVHFLLVGNGSRMPIVKQILGSEKSEFWTLAGLVPQAEAAVHLAATDILVSPHVPNKDGSRFFGSPTKLFEYMAMGKPIIASDLDQIGDVLSNSLRARHLPHGECAGNEDQLALLCRPACTQELILSIKFLAEHPQWRRLLGRNASNEALRKYTWKAHVDRILETLHRVQGRKQC